LREARPVPVVRFTRNLERHVACPSEQVDGATVRDALHAYFGAHPEVRRYVLDDQGRVRRHVTIFVAGTAVVDRDGQSDPVGTTDEVYVMQALSGGCT
jgi:hypothetical protein